MAGQIHSHKPYPLLAKNFRRARSGQHVHEAVDKAHNPLGSPMGTHAWLVGLRPHFSETSAKSLITSMES